MDGTIYIGSSDTYLYAINPDGTLKWSYQTGNEIRSSPAIGADGTIYVGSFDNYLYAIKPYGSLKWKSLTNGSVYCSPVIGTDGTLYIGSNDGYLYAFAPEKEISVENEAPASYILNTPSPNPFNPNTTISFYTPRSGHISLEVYSLTGQKVATLVNGTVNIGLHKVIFDGTGLASGVYFYRFGAAGFSKTGKMLLIK
jgi:hypothetical protein